MSRFEEAGELFEEKLQEVINNNFPILSSANFSCIFDLKKRKSNGKYVVGKIQKANDLMKHLSATNENPDGIDYLIYVDKAVWNTIDTKDKERLLYNVLCYTDVDFDKPSPYNTRDAEIKTFYEEIEYNKDDPRWMERLEAIATSIYESEE